MEKNSYQEIWNKLIAVEVGEFIESKNGFDYLSWSRAWALLMAHYPAATFEFDEVVIFADGSAEVGCTIRIGDSSRHCTLAVMNFKNEARSNPNSVDIQKAKQRVFVKAIAYFGLGFSVFLGEKVESTLVFSNMLDKLTTIIDRDYREIFLNWKEFREFIKNYKGLPIDELDFETVEKMIGFFGNPAGQDVSSWSNDFLEAHTMARLGRE
jgi:hypothetical protein|tara:strand:+ start:4326 stop:4955 length:630 start_codon:yes stop_codon:yes gene_type:complete